MILGCLVLGTKEKQKKKEIAQIPKGDRFSDDMQSKNFLGRELNGHQKETPKGNNVDSAHDKNQQADFRFYHL